MAGNGSWPERAQGTPGAPGATDLELDQTLSELDQTHADADQTAADRDHEASLADAASSYADQASADRDQHASDRDQASADRDHASAPMDAINDRDGHAGGDALLRAVADALKSRLRSYDQVVRIGGDEFVCGFTNTELPAAERRIHEIQATIAHSQPASSISVGLAELRAGDTLEHLIARGDQELYEAKQRK